MIQPIINDYESYKDRIFILNPDTGVFVSAKEWIEKADDPTRAEILAVQTPYYAIVFPKKFLKGTFNFEEAQKAVSEFEAAGLNIEYKWRSPRRNESNYIYDAYWSGMKEVLEKIGGDSFETRWWTCEKDSWSCSRRGARRLVLQRLPRLRVQLLHAQQPRGASRRAFIHERSE